MRFATIAPRLARAHAAWIAWDLDRDRRRRELIDDRLRLERLVAHRELQVVRAAAACGRAGSVHARRSAGIYLRRRQTLLSEAEAALKRTAKRLRAVERER